MNTTDLNHACGMIDRAADKVAAGGRLTTEQLDQLHIYLIKLNKAIYGGYNDRQTKTPDSR